MERLKPHLPNRRDLKSRLDPLKTVHGQLPAASCRGRTDLVTGSIVEILVIEQIDHRCLIGQKVARPPWEGDATENGSVATEIEIETNDLLIIGANHDLPLSLFANRPLLLPPLHLPKQTNLPPSPQPPPNKTPAVPAPLVVPAAVTVLVTTHHCQVLM